MKNLFVLFCFALLSFGANGQTMQWVPLSPGNTLGNCKSQATESNGYKCYILQYIPAVSGTLTSYTTGFFVSCTSTGPSVVFNQSCSMANNTNLIDGCGDFGKVLMNSSGNSGGPGDNKIVAGRPVYLHQVCFSIPQGEEVSIIEDDLTDLTTSIDLGGGQVVTEAPNYITQTVGRPKFNSSTPANLLDFVAQPVDGHKTQLDWTLLSDKKEAKFSIEHSVDGTNFTPVGEVTASDKVDPAIQSYQYLDQPTADGVHFYRLKLYDDRGSYDYSPVRLVNFSPADFVVKAWPSPVSDILNVYISHAGQNGHMELLDPTGKKVIEEDFSDGNSDHQINVNAFASGLYTLVAVSGSQRLNEKVVVVH
jgi:hypothetical protein